MLQYDNGSKDSIFVCFGLQRTIKNSQAQITVEYNKPLSERNKLSSPKLIFPNVFTETPNILEKSPIAASVLEENTQQYST